MIQQNGQHSNNGGIVDGGKGELQVLDMDDHKNRGLARRAFKERWHVPEVIKRRLIAQCGVAIKKSDMDPRAIGQIGRVLMEAEKQNQQDEHVHIKVQGGHTGDINIQVIYEAPKLLEEQPE